MHSGGSHLKLFKDTMYCLEQFRQCLEDCEQFRQCLEDGENDLGEAVLGCRRNDFSRRAGSGWGRSLKHSHCPC